MQFQLMQDNYNKHFASVTESVSQSTNAKFLIVVAEAANMYTISYMYI